MNAQTPSRVERMRHILAASFGVPDDVWSFPADVFNRRKPPIDYIEIGAWDLVELRMKEGTDALRPRLVEQFT